MTRRKKEDEYDFSRRSTEDLMQQKSTQKIKLPKIQQGPARANGVPQQRKAERLLRQSTDGDHRESNLHLPYIAEAAHNDREQLYYDKPDSWELQHQAKMEFVARKMMQKHKNVNDHHPLQMSTNFPYDADSSRYHLEYNGWEDNFDGYGYLYQRETAEISSTERERELDKKRQAMLELKDKQVKFFRKHKQQNLEQQYLSGQTQFYTEKQHPTQMFPTCQEPQDQSKRKKATKTKQGKRARQNANDAPKHLRHNETQRNDNYTYKEKVLPNLHEVSETKYENETSRWFHSPDGKSSFFRRPTREEMESNLICQLNNTHNSRVPNHMPSPPIRQQLTATQPLPPICEQPDVVQPLPPILENQQCTHSPLPVIRKHQNDGVQSVSSPPSAFEHILQLPHVKERRHDVYQASSSPVDCAELSTGESSGSDSVFELDIGNILEIPAHVVTDEELRKELRLDLSFARTPVPKKKSKQSAKQSTVDDKTSRKTRRKEDRS